MMGTDFNNCGAPTMGGFKPVNSQITVAGAMTLHDIARAAAGGFRTIVNFRPDGESPDQLAAAKARRAAERHGVRYVHIPTTKFDVFTDAVVEAAQAAFRDASGPVLVHCASGQRAAIVWAAAQARGGSPVSSILGELTAAGFEFGFLRDDLEAQADRVRWRDPAPESLAESKVAADHALLTSKAAA